jgi:ADP-heptose:LPS heptosyltransferase
MNISNRNLFRITRFILLKGPYFLKFLSIFRKKSKRILIIKTDAIGDYVLFNNFIEILGTSEEYKGYELDLLGNRLWAEIALQYNSKLVNEFFFINADELYEAPLKTLRLGFKLFSRNYRVVLQPAYSRTLINDGIAALTVAPQIIGFKSDNESIDAKYKQKTDRFYTQLILLPVECYFEYDRTKHFFEVFLVRPVPGNGPYLKSNGQRGGHIVIFTGSGVIKRNWEPEKFLELIQRIVDFTLQPIYLAGGPAEVSTAGFLLNNLPPGRVKDLTGKTSLPQLVEIIATAALVISNETSAIHIAAATHTPAICVLGGGHFGRFAPYPGYITHKPACVYNKMDCFNCNWNCIFETKPDEPYPCISLISVDEVWQKTKAALISNKI